MFYTGYLVGVISSGLLLSLGFYLALQFSSGTELGNAAAVPRIFKKQQKKKPSYVSEEEQWRREQKQTPRDPGL